LPLGVGCATFGNVASGVAVIVGGNVSACAELIPNTFLMNQSLKPPSCDPGGALAREGIGAPE
jgi:hypothetical protein